MSTTHITLSSNSEWDYLTDTLTVDHQSGFFDAVTIMLGNLIDIHKQIPNRPPIKNIIWKKNPMVSDCESNNYPLFFCQSDNRNEISLGSPVKGPWVSHNFHEINFTEINKIIKQYFNLSEGVMEIRDGLSTTYNVIPEKTIAIYYRGTDHINNIQPRTSHYTVINWIIKNLLGEDLSLLPEYRIMIQTDQKQIRDFFNDHLKKRERFYFQELPVAEGDIGLHKISQDERGMSITKHQMTFLSTIHIMSKRLSVGNK